MLLVATRTCADMLCLTKNQARHLWPISIYIGLADHCWSIGAAHRAASSLILYSAARRSAKSRAEKLDEFNELDAMADKPPVEDIIETRPFGPWEERVAGAFTQ